MGTVFSGLIWVCTEDIGGGKSCYQLLEQEGGWFMTLANQKRTRAEALGSSQLGYRRLGGRRAREGGVG